MTYELAEELKNAGFPVNEYGYAPDIFKGGFIAPSLDELIEATQLDYLNREASEWVAVKTGIMGSPTKHGRGDTPGEAIARLWLALNSKV